MFLWFRTPYRICYTNDQPNQWWHGIKTLGTKLTNSNVGCVGQSNELVAYTGVDFLIGYWLRKYRESL